MSWSDRESLVLIYYVLEMGILSDAIIIGINVFITEKY